MSARRFRSIAEREMSEVLYSGTGNSATRPSCTPPTWPRAGGTTLSLTCPSSRVDQRGERTSPRATWSRGCAAQHHYYHGLVACHVFR
jgi:hypothetical protein